jgi:mannose-6-phosphate isomerase-like protein (cupin superfamily)
VSGPAPAFLTTRSAEFFTAELCHITELSNSPVDEALSVAQARVEPGVTTRWHCLHGIAERYVIVSVHGVAEVGELPPQAVAPGDVVVIPAGCRQRIRNDGGHDLVFHALCTPRFRPEA